MAADLAAIWIFAVKSIANNDAGCSVPRQSRAAFFRAGGGNNRIIGQLAAITGVGERTARDAVDCYTTPVLR